MMSKIIKKIAKLLAYVLLILFLIPTLLTGIIQIPVVQNYAVSKTLQWIGTKIGTELHFSSVRITTFNHIRFNDLYIADQAGDTLLYAKKTRAVMPAIFSFIFKKDPITRPLKKLEFEESVINFSIDSTQTINFQFILDYIIAGKKSEKKGGTIKIGRISLSDSRFTLTAFNSPVDTMGIDFGRMRLNKLNCNVRDLEIRGDTIALHIRPVSFVEASGFNLQSMSADMELCGTYLHFLNLKINTPQSAIEADRINMDFSDYKDFSPDSLFEKIIFEIAINEGSIDFFDIGFFVDLFNNYSQKINFEGLLKGPLSNLKGKKLILEWGSSSQLSGDFDLKGLPDIQQTFLYFKMNHLLTTRDDIVSIHLPGNNKLELPEFLKSLKEINYQGNFTGFFDDFVAHGKLSTNLGTVFTDLMFTPDTSNTISISGRVSTENFQIGKMLNSELIRDITMDMAITGTYSKSNPLIANLNGDITKLTFKEYPYQNIHIDGILSNKRFDGKINVDDPNLIMEFQGLIDMVADLPKYHFRANIIDANLSALNISDADPEYHASFLFKANATGKNLDDINGEFNLLNSLFSKTDKQIQIYDLNAIVRNDAEANELIVRSDILDADIIGKYTISQLKDDFVLFFSRYIPAVFEEQLVGIDNLINSNFDFDINFKRTQPFFEFFFPNYLIGESSTLKGTYRPENMDQISLTFITPELKVSNNSLKGLVVNIDSDDSTVYATLGSQFFNISQRFDLENFTLESSIIKNDIAFTTRWLNWDTTLNKGSISGHVLFHEKSNNKLISILCNPSSITVNDSIWKINNYVVNLDTAGISIENLRIEHRDQYMVANGKISDLPGDTLHFSFNNFDLANLNFFTQKQNIEFSGLLNGSGNLTGIKSNPLFFSSLEIENLVFNGEEFGNCTIQSLWDNRKESLNIYAEAQRGLLTMLKVKGDFYPTRNGRMDFDITLSKLKANILNPFTKGIFSDFHGLISGDLKLTGSKDNPSLSGNLKLLKNAFMVDYLKTRYNLTTEVEIINNNFILNNIEIFDQEGNYGVLNGMVRTEYLKDITLNLGINIYNLLCLDTKVTDNEMFYGTAHATGSVKIRGAPSTLSFDIEAETNKNTHLFIPLSQSTEVLEYNYISFTRTDTADNETDPHEIVQKVSLAGLQMNFNLKVTPDAEVQIIFDPTMGDIIKARGTGEIVMSINTLGTFNMVGEYAIEKGEYLFTLQNIINKRLKIDEGSNMRWTGDPLDAVVDITAVYRTKASPLELYSEEAQNRVTVDCRIFLTGNLMSPNIRYDIYLPFSDEETRNRVNSKIQSEEELNKQFLSLLVMNRFIPSTDNTNQSNEGYMAGVNNASELLSNQFSNWLSQISNDFDLGFTYRPGDIITSNEVEVAMSTQLLNNRLTINGSVDMNNGQAENSGKIVGDVDLDYKINDKGKTRLHAYNHSNEGILNEQSPYTQGVGILYKEEFNSFGELLKLYWTTLTGKRKKAKPEELDINME